MIGEGTIGDEGESELIRTFPFCEAKKVWLSYESENIRAREIYKKYGFIENGDRCEGEIIAVYDL